MFTGWGTLQRERDGETLADFKNCRIAVQSCSTRYKSGKGGRRSVLSATLQGWDYSVTGEKEVWHDHICILESSEPWFSTGGNFTSGATGNVWRHFRCYHWSCYRQGCDEHPTMHRSIMKRNYVAQNENSAEGRNPGFELISRVEELRLEAGDGLICNSGRAEAMLLNILHSSSKPAWDTTKRRSLYSGFLVAQMVKNLPEMWETWVQFLSQEDLLEKRMITHSSIPIQRTPWT